jgi:hypothetical protein
VLAEIASGTRPHCLHDVRWRLGRGDDEDSKPLGVEVPDGGGTLEAR